MRRVIESDNKKQKMVLFYSIDAECRNNKTLKGVFGLVKVGE